MNVKKQIRRKLINLQNLYGKQAGKLAWKTWKENQKKENTNG